MFSSFSTTCIHTYTPKHTYTQSCFFWIRKSLLAVYNHSFPFLKKNCYSIILLWKSILKKLINYWYIYRKSGLIKLQQEKRKQSLWKWNEIMNVLLIDINEDSEWECGIWAIRWNNRALLLKFFFAIAEGKNHFYWAKFARL